MRGEAYETTDPAWHLRTAPDAAAPFDVDILRGYGRLASMLATADEALIKPGLVERDCRHRRGAASLQRRTRAGRSRPLAWCMGRPSLIRVC